MSHPAPDCTEAKCESRDANQQQPQSSNQVQNDVATTTATPTTPKPPTIGTINQIHGQGDISFLVDYTVSHPTNIATTTVPTTESSQRQIQLDQRLQSMYDEIKNERRDIEFEKKVVEFETKRQQAQIEADKRDFELCRREAEMEARQRELTQQWEMKQRELAQQWETKQREFETKQTQFQSIMDQYYLSSGVNNSWVFGNDDGHHQNHNFKNNKPAMTTPPPQEQSASIDATQPVPIILTRSDVDTARVELTSKMDEITQGRKQIRGIIKQLEIQRDDLVRKQFHFDNHVKSADDEIKAQWDQIQSRQDDLQIAYNELQTDRDQFTTTIKIKQDEVEKTRLGLITASGDLSQLLLKLNLDISKHTEVADLIGQSITNPIAMEKLQAIVDFKLKVDAVKKMVAIPDDEFHKYYEIINQCNKNSKYYGAEDSRVQIQFRCEQLSKQFHLYYPHYIDLVRIIFDTGNRKHINPHKTNMTFNSHAITNYFWKSDSDSGKMPPLTPELKLFFKSPNIANNTWIQCSGPGTMLWDIDPSFKLTVGSLCDPNGEGKFKSINSQDKESDPGGKFNGATFTSPYQISFKWE